MPVAAAICKAILSLDMGRSSARLVGFDEERRLLCLLAFRQLSAVRL
jgi:hypothetical protein